MQATIAGFKKKKDFLVCIDSDGCAMDTMDIKHKKCFGPKAIEIWGLQEYQDKFLDIWNNINLYSRNRGINRFKGLVMALDQLSEIGVRISDYSVIREWTETSPELSNPALEKAIVKTSNSQLKKALAWSNAVNKAISELPAEDKPFHNVKEGLAKICTNADIAIVSSANGTAIQKEWTRHELAQYVNVLLGQEAGSKAACIKALKENEYSEDYVLMVGDAPGDLQAAQKNGVLFYPILVGKESYSWERLIHEAMMKFLDGTYRGQYQQRLIDELNSILK